MSLIGKLRLALKLKGAYYKSAKEAEKGRAMNKSKTVWGGIIAGIGAIAAAIGAQLQDGSAIHWNELLPQIVTVIGAVIGVIGARGAVQKIIDK